MEYAYTHYDAFHNDKAGEAIIPYLFSYYRPQSVLDIGCGLGHWLKACIKHGATDCVGVDWTGVSENELVIDPANFLGVDLRQPFDLQRQFDLAICLEVGEHLEAAHAENLVASIVRHSNVVLFSAAVPGQGGQFHVNEQWPIYWQNLFGKHGFVAFDFLRERFWDDQNVDPWYRQNIVIYARPEYSFGQHEPVKKLRALVHPEILALHSARLQECEDFRQRITFKPDLLFGIKVLGKAMLKPFRSAGKKRYEN